MAARKGMSAPPWAPPIIAPQGRGRLALLLCVSVPSFMINLDGNIVAVSLPSISRSLGADFATVEWVMSAYTLAFAALVLPAGALADRYGRKAMLLAGLTLFTLASLVCGAAPTANVLIGARAVQGVGAAFQLSAALAILSHEFRGAERARAFAFWGSVIGVGITIGPLAGGVLTQTLGWQWAFYINGPIGAALVSLIVTTLHESSDPEAAKLDLPGFLTFSIGLFLLTYALISGNHLGWSARPVISAVGGAAVLLALFCAIELRTARPMLELHFFAKPTFLGANLAGVTYAAALLTMLTYLPLFFQGGLGASPISAGLLMLPIAAPLFFVPRIVSRYFAHVLSGRVLVTIGLLLVAVGMGLVSAFAGNLRFAPLIPGLLVAGSGAGILNGETAKVGVSAIPPERAGMASGLSGAMRFTGIVVGFAAMGALLYASIASTLATAIDPRAGQFRQLVQAVATGKLAAAGRASGLSSAILRSSFATGYETIFATAAVLAAAAAGGCWLLIRANETSAVGGLPAGEPELPIDL